MKIKRLTVEIEQDERRGSVILRVDVIADGNIFKFEIVQPESDFESRFDYLMDLARRSLLSQIKEQENKTRVDSD